MRKAASILLSAAIAVLSPGLTPYEALAGITVRSAGKGGTGVVTGKTSTGAGSVVSQTALHSIAPSAVVSNLVTVDPALDLVAPESNPENPVALPAPSPSLVSPRRAAVVSQSVISPPRTSPDETVAPRAPPAALRTLENFGPDAGPVDGNKGKKDGDSAFALASAASVQSVRFDGASLRPQGSHLQDFAAPTGKRWVGRANQLNAADSPPKADVEVLFADQFVEAVREQSTRSGKDRWGKKEWDRFKNDIQNFVNGAGSSAVGTKRGKAVEVGVFKFKWADRGVRVFARLDPTGTQLTILDLKTKEDLLNGEEAQYYEDLAQSVADGRIRGFGMDALPKMGRQVFSRLRLPETAITARFKKAKTIYGWRSESAAAEADDQIKDVRNGADDGVGFGPQVDLSPEALESGILEPELEGTLDRSKYKVPFGIRAKRAVFLGIHYGGFAAFTSFLAVALGWLPALIGFSAVGAAALTYRITRNLNGAVSPFVEDGTTGEDLLELRDDLMRLQEGESFSEEELADLDERVKPLYSFLQWAKGAAQVLVNRAGFEGYRAPQLKYFEGGADPDVAYSSLGELDRASTLYIGVGFLARPLGETVAMMAHELGHFVNKDFGFFHEYFRANSDGVGFNRGLKWTAGITTIASVAAIVTAFFNGTLFVIDPVSVGVAIGFLAGGFMSVVAGLLAGFAVMRQNELRADHFSSWLTNPRWWISWLRMRAGPQELEGDTRSLWDRLMSNHPDYAARIAALESYQAPSEMQDVPQLPQSNSVYGLNGETTVLVRGMDAASQEAIEAFYANLNGSFEAQVFFVQQEGEPTGLGVVRLHRKDRAQLDKKTDAEAVEAVRVSAAKEYPGSEILSATSKPHEVFRWAAKSATARAALRSLKKSGVPIRWDVTLGEDDARGIFRAEGENGPEILLNAAVLFEASPKALLALIAHEAYHARVWAKMREIGIDWLNLGGLEFERLAHSVGLRVFSEVKGTSSDDLINADGGLVFDEAMEQWKSLEEDAHLKYLKEHGYESFLRLRDLRAQNPKDLAAELGLDESPESIAKKLELLGKFYQAEKKSESRWQFWSFLR